MSRVSNISDSNNTSIQFTFDANGKRLSEVLSNGSVTSYSYNAINKLTQIKTVNSLQQVLHELNYTHDNTGNILSETNETGFQKTYSYDVIYQLLGVNYTGGEFINYSYDDAGNRLTQNKNGITTNYTYNNLNQLIQSIESGVTTQYNYDLKGNLIQSSNPSQTIIYNYNFMNKIASITKTGLENTALTMNYNGIGHRTGKTYSDGKIYSYLYSGNNIIEETSNQYTGGVAYYLMGGIDEVFARTINNSPEFYLKDNLNSLRKVIDNTQRILNTADYEHFGSIRNGDAGNHNYLYTGREKDFNDVYYYRARTFSPISGRFQQKDPIGINGGLNLYVYCGNNPINYMDPLGLYDTSLESYNDVGELFCDMVGDMFPDTFNHYDPPETETITVVEQSQQSNSWQNSLVSAITADAMIGGGAGLISTGLQSGSVIAASIIGTEGIIIVVAGVWILGETQGWWK